MSWRRHLHGLDTAQDQPHPPIPPGGGERERERARMVIAEAEAAGFVREPSLPAAYETHLLDDAAEAADYLRRHAAGDPRPTLDERQREAVSAPAGPMLILAGAGSGKTRVLTERAARLAEQPDTGPAGVVVITFTNRAADELRARLAVRLGDERAAPMTIGTFHAVCHRLLRCHPDRIGRSSAFSVYDGHATGKLIAATIKQHGLESEGIDTALVANQIGHAKARLLDPDGYRALARSPRAAAIAAAYAAYQEGLAQSDAVDFDDLLMGAVGLFADDALVSNYRRRWRAVLVDEYQDTNPAQDAWLRRLVGPEPNVTVVGDPGQAIYSWRGADVGNILTFADRFPGTRVHRLERNYRSAGAIVAAGARLAAHLDGPVQMWTNAAPGVPVATVGCDDERDEAERAASWARQRLDAGVGAAEVAVLFRTRAQARPIEDAMLLAGVACRLQGTRGLFDTAAVRDLVAHLALLANRWDRIALTRALGCQPGVGKMTIARVMAASDTGGTDPVTTCIQAQPAAGISGRAALAVEAFGRVLDELGSDLARRGVGQTVTDTVVGTGLADRLAAKGTDQAEEQLEALRRFCRAAHRYQHTADAPDLADFLAQAALAGGDDDPEGKAQVTLSTLHAAKGAEWDHVWLAGACEGLLPHHRSMLDGNLAEERRLAYVAITRARASLTVSWPEVRYGRDTQRSRFVTEAGLAGTSAAAPTDGRLAA